MDRRTPPGWASLKVRRIHPSGPARWMRPCSPIALSVAAVTAPIRARRVRKEWVHDCETGPATARPDRHVRRCGGWSAWSHGKSRVDCGRVWYSALLPYCHTATGPGLTPQCPSFAMRHMRTGPRPASLYGLARDQLRPVLVQLGSRGLDRARVRGGSRVRCADGCRMGTGERLIGEMMRMAHDRRRIDGAFVLPTLATCLSAWNRRQAQADRWAVA